MRQASLVSGLFKSYLFISLSSPMRRPRRRRCNFLPKRRRALSDRPNVLHFDLKEEKSERSYHLSFLFFLVKIGVCSVGHFCARRSTTSFSRGGLCGGYSRATFRARKVAFISKKRFLVFNKKKTEIE